MTIQAYPGLRIGTGEVAKKFENSLEQGGRIHLGTTVLVFFFRHARHGASYKT